MDGLEEIDNVIVFGLTNRKELLEPALMRPGRSGNIEVKIVISTKQLLRFEVQIEIGMPTEEGRYEILDISTQSMALHGLMSSDIDLRALAKLTPRYSGAEITSVVRFV